MQNRKIVIPKSGRLAKLMLIDAPLPEPQSNQILVKTEACGVAFADVLMREGLYPKVDKRNLTPGYDIIGEIIQGGSEVSGFKVGDRVASLTQTGGYADFVLADASLSVHCPTDLPADKVNALILNYTTAYQMLARVAKVSSGDTILVHGVAGGVGSALLELALPMGLVVYGTLSRRKWNALAPALDGHPNFHKIDYQEKPFELSMKGFAPDGVDAVFDAIGGEHLKRSYRLVKPGGTLVSFGFSTALPNGRRSIPAALKGLWDSILLPTRLIGDSVAVAGYGIWTFAKAHPDWFRDDLSQLIQKLVEGKLHPIVSRHYRLEEIEEAQNDVSRSSLPGKVILQMA